MSTATETIAFLANYNSWRRGDETIEMPAPAEIGATIDDAVNLLRKYDDLEARAERAEALLGQLQELHGCSQEMVVHWCARAAERSLELGKAQAELAIEREKVRVLREALEEAQSGELIGESFRMARAALAATEDRA